MKRELLPSCLALALVCLFSSVSGGQQRVLPYETQRKGASENGYGQMRPVKTSEQALARLGEHFAGKGVKVGRIKEKELFFEAEILDAAGRLVDKVAVDKRTGGVRSIY